MVFFLIYLLILFIVIFIIFLIRWGIINHLKRLEKISKEKGKNVRFTSFFDYTDKKELLHLTFWGVTICYWTFLGIVYFNCSGCF